MVLLGYEVVGNLDMPGDGHIGGENFFCEKVCISKIKEKQEKRNISQLLGLQTYLVNLFVEL